MFLVLLLCMKRVHHDFRRRILRDVQGDPPPIPVTQLATNPTNAITLAEAVTRQPLVASSSQEILAREITAEDKGNTNTVDMQTTLLLKLLENKQSSRQLVALYLALASEVSSSSAKRGIQHDTNINEQLSVRVQALYLPLNRRHCTQNLLCCFCYTLSKVDDAIGHVLAELEALEVTAMLGHISLTNLGDSHKRTFKCPIWHCHSLTP